MDRAKSPRNPLLDMARIVAVLAVVMIHCSADFIANYPLHTSEFISGNLFDSISRMAVPLFLMISGALFLDQDRELSFKSILSNDFKLIYRVSRANEKLYMDAMEVAFENSRPRYSYEVEAVILPNTNLELG